jgi:hypothetical protein
MKFRAHVVPFWDFQRGCMTELVSIAVPIFLHLVRGRSPTSLQP